MGTSAASLREQQKDGGRTEELQVETGVREDVEESQREVNVEQVQKSDEPSAKAACGEAVEGEETQPKVASHTAASDLRSAEEKMGKQGLLELLTAMKVDTTTTTKLKSLRKVTSGQDVAGKPKRAVMESTSSMFQQATTSQR